MKMVCFHLDLEHFESTIDEGDHRDLHQTGGICRFFRHIYQFDDIYSSLCHRS